VPRKFPITTVVVIVLLTAVSALADYTFELRGTWPKTWPSELEPLRERSQTFVGGEILLQHFAIPFDDRDEFETVWPHILRVKTPGSSIVLRRKSDFWLAGRSAGVCVHAPPKGQKGRSPEPGDAKDEFEWTSIYIELVVDGEIIDLNRIPIPPNTPIIDERFTGDVTPAD